MRIQEWDLSDWDDLWSRRAPAALSVIQRSDRRGMTRPRRDEDERQWLAERGELPPTIETDTPNRPTTL